MFVLKRFTYALVILYCNLDMVAIESVNSTAPQLVYLITAKTTTIMPHYLYVRVLLLTWVAAMLDFSDLTACILFSRNSLFCCSFSASC